MLPDVLDISFDGADFTDPKLTFDDAVRDAMHVQDLDGFSDAHLVLPVGFLPDERSIGSGFKFVKWKTKKYFRL